MYIDICLFVSFTTCTVHFILKHIQSALILRKQCVTWVLDTKLNAALCIGNPPHLGDTGYVGLQQFYKT